MEGCGIEDIVNIFSNELELIQGRYYKNGEIACLDVEKSQIFQTSIRDNIILTSAYDPDKFSSVLEIVGLNIQNYYGQEYFVIKKAQEFSNIDKIKIFLARLIYQNANIFVVHNLFSQVSKSVA